MLGTVCKMPGEAVALPQVSFVVPAHNEAAYLRPTLEAIFQAIDSLSLTAEVIVVDDASTDATAELATSLGARVIPVQLRNIAAVRNAGAAGARYGCLIFIDADTQVPAETVRQSLLRLARGDSGGGARVVIPDEYQIFWVKRWMFYAVVLGWQILGGWAAGCYIFCRKDAFEAAGGFDDQYFAAEEYFLSQALRRQGRFSLVRNPVVTSSRKLHRYTTWELARFLWVPLLDFGQLFRSKRGLELLYEDQR